MRCWASDSGTLLGARSARPAPARRRRCRPAGQCARPVGDGRRVEQRRAPADAVPSAAPSRATDLRGEQRVAAEVEEDVVDADPLEPEHVGEDAGDQLLGRACAGSTELALQRVEVGGGQRASGRACPRASAGARRARRRGRHHVRRQRLRRRNRVSSATSTVAPAAGTHVRRPARSYPTARRADGDRELDVRVRGQRGVDLAELDPEAADLHLEVAAAHVLDAVTARCPCRHRTRSPVRYIRLAGRAERVGDETFGGQAGAAW